MQPGQSPDGGLFHQVVVIPRRDMQAGRAVHRSCRRGGIALAVQDGLSARQAELVDGDGDPGIRRPARCCRVSIRIPASRDCRAGFFEPQQLVEHFDELGEPLVSLTRREGVLAQHERVEVVVLHEILDEYGPFEGLGFAINA